MTGKRDARFVRLANSKPTSYFPKLSEPDVARIRAATDVFDYGEIEALSRSDEARVNRGLRKKAIKFLDAAPDVVAEPAAESAPEADSPA